MTSADHLKQLATQVRRDILRMVHKAQSGHPGGALGCTELLVALYNKILIHNPKTFTIDGKGQDVFFLSNGHLSALWYSVLARSGYFGVSELSTFRMMGSRLQGHPATQEGLPGIRISSGSLGQGLSVAIGMAKVKKLNSDPHLVYVLMGDGEIQEGQIWEAAMFAGGKQVDNLIAIIDYNKKQIDGATDDVMPLGDVKAKWEAFGWSVLEMNGNDMDEVLETLKESKTKTGQQKPVLILMKTEMGMGVDFMMGTHKWHGSPPNDQQLENALNQLEETIGDYKI
ncbi:MAG: transketolase [Bacteroidales bacterium]|nr:transketolase [Bacteroidales bacterium]